MVEEHVLLKKMKEKGVVLSERSESKGFAQIFLVVILLAGLVAAVILVQNRTNFFPKAYEPIYPYPTPTPPSSSYCTSRISKFSLDQPCGGPEIQGFKSAKYYCQTTIETQISEPEGSSGLRSLEADETCRSIEEWVSRAKEVCWSKCSTITPTLSLSPTPSATSVPTTEPPYYPPAPPWLDGSCSYSPNMQAKLSWGSVSGSIDYTVSSWDATKINTDYNVSLPDVITTGTSVTMGTQASHNYGWNVTARNSRGTAQSETAYFECPPPK